MCDVLSLSFTITAHASCLVFYVQHQTADRQISDLPVNMGGTSSYRDRYFPHELVERKAELEGIS